MKNAQDVQDWLDYLEDRGVEEGLLSKYGKYCLALVNNGQPPILELEHLSQLLGIKLSALASMIARPDLFYRQFEIPKRRGGSRVISAPYPSLLRCQRWIYENILINCRVHEAAHGFVRGRSIVSNASAHVGKKMLLKMDLKDFFPSIPFAWVITYFNRLGYAKNVAYFLASLCCVDGFLIQGAATSPSLANILTFRMDSRLSGLAQKFNIDYTRYADDLIFSGDDIPLRFSEIVAGIIVECGLKVNNEKTRLHRKIGKRVVTGISVAGNILKLPRETTRELKLEFHFIRKFGLVGHLNNQKMKNPFYLDSMIGRFSFWLQIEPDNIFAKEGFNFLLNLARDKM